MSNDAQETLQIIDFGFQVEAFLTSEIGRFLVKRAEAEVEEAIDLLKTVKPTEPDAIRDLQTKIWRGESIQYWLAEVIQNGVIAQQQLIEQSS